MRKGGRERRLFEGFLIIRKKTRKGERLLTRRYAEKERQEGKWERERELQMIKREGGGAMREREELFQKKKIQRGEYLVFSSVEK